MRPLSRPEREEKKMSCLYERTLDPLDAVTAWTVFGNDTINLATTNRRVRGLKAMEFDKVNGAANKTYAGASRAVAFDLSPVNTLSELAWHVYLSSIAAVAYAWLRLGTDAANYVEYRYADTLLTAGVFTYCHRPLYQFDAIAGTCCAFDTITYMDVGVEFDAETDALADIAIDHIEIIPAMMTRS